MELNIYSKFNQFSIAVSSLIISFEKYNKIELLSTLKDFLAQNKNFESIISKIENCKRYIEEYLNSKEINEEVYANSNVFDNYTEKEKNKFEEEKKFNFSTNDSEENFFENNCNDNIYNLVNISVNINSNNCLSLETSNFNYFEKENFHTIKN